jgi:hypothetical protein
MQIKVRLKTTYGRELIYPACEKAELFASLTKKKTLTIDEIKVIEELGFEIVIEPQTIGEK